MNPVYEKLQSCLKSVRAKTDFQPKIALILGSGLGDYADGIGIVDTIDYNEIEGFQFLLSAAIRAGSCSDMLRVFRWSSCRGAFTTMKAIR